MSGALESSPTSSSVATPPSTMRTMQTSLLRSSKVAPRDIFGGSSDLILVFFQGSLSSTLPTGTTSAKKRKTSSALSCVSTSRTDWPASEFPLLTFTFVSSFRCNILLLLPTCTTYSGWCCLFFLTRKLFEFCQHGNSHICLAQKAKTFRQIFWFSFLSPVLWFGGV